MPGNAASQKRISNSWPRTRPTINSLPSLAGPLAARQRRRKNIRRMRRVLLPINVVVIHAADHQRVGQRRGDGIDPLAGANYRGRARARLSSPRTSRAILTSCCWIATERAADGIEQEALGLVDRVLREVLILQAGSPAGHLGSDRLFRFGNRSLCRQGTSPLRLGLEVLSDS